jgi:2-amino-4-hydroxy-6-hydroxymethyldihydropteridine diphosphokinase
MSIVYLLSGSNLGNRWENICNAEREIRKLELLINSLSPVFESPSWGFDHPKAFLNQAMEISTSLKPKALLKELLDIERHLGRVRNKNGYEARVIDIDILFYDDLIIEDKELILPHPRVHLRRFALLPLSKIKATLVHPAYNKNISELLKDCRDDSTVTEYAEGIDAVKKGDQANAI